MILRHNLLRKANMVTFGLLFAAAWVLIATFAYTVNIHVLKNWKIIIPSGDIHEGDTIVVQSVYAKLRPVVGVATRYLECQNNTNAFIRYPLNVAIADRPPGSSTGTGVILKMPTSIPDVPTTCRISINVTYPVYPWRKVTEFASSPEFRLLPEVTSSSTGL